MKKANEHEAYSIRVKPYVLVLALIWSATVAASLLWNTYQTRQEIIDVARVQARGSFMKDVIYRRWNAGHGGVYVPVTDETPPNSYIKVPERDIITQSGIVLTLINPAYMTRQVHELAAKESGIQGHITSLNPIRPANAPDSWETRALESFQHGAKEISSIEELKGDAYMRLMRPLFTEEACLKCHALQGYKIGDIRGGISVSVPMSPLRAVGRSYMLALSAGHGLIWLVGLAGIGFGAHRLNRQITKRKQAEKEREEMIHELQNALAKVKRLSGLLPICSSCKKVRDDKGYWSQIEIYIRDHSEADFSHSICPECAKKIYPDLNVSD